MPYRKANVEKGQLLHVLSRAVEERKIFEREEDCYRFMFQIFASNVGKPSLNLYKKDVIKAAKSLLRGEDISSKFITKEHPPFVYILDFSLVVNHYHLCLVLNEKDGLPLFMKKLNGGFAKYFNLKYGRRGSLFGSRYGSIPIKTEFQSDAVSRYVSIINPLDVFQPGWREEGLKNWKGAFNFLRNYPFSSFPDKIGERESKILAPQEISERYCPVSNLTQKEYFQFVRGFLSQKTSISKDLFLEKV